MVLRKLLEQTPKLTLELIFNKAYILANVVKEGEGKKEGKRGVGERAVC